MAGALQHAPRHSTSVNENLPVFASIRLPRSQPFRNVVKDLFTAQQHTRDIGADLNVMLSHWAGAQHTVKCNHFMDINLRNVNELREILNHLRGM